MIRKNWFLKHVLLVIFLSAIFNKGYSQSGDIIQFKPATSLPVGLYAMATATDEKRIYIKGGGTSFNQYSSGYYIYDIELKEWLDLSKSINLKPTKFGKGVYMTEFNTIAFIGGITPVINSVRIIPSIIGYDLETYRFSSLGNSPLISKSLGVAYWKDKVYMFGGSLSLEPTVTGFVQKFTNEMYSYSPENGEIESLPNHPEAKEMKGEILNGLIYTFGGFDDQPNKNIHAYNIKEKVWDQIGSFENPVYAYALVKYNKYMLLIGGDNTQNRQMIVFDTQSNTWEVYQMNFGGAHMGAVIVKNTLHVFGGKEGSGVSKQHRTLNLESFFNR